KAMVSASTSPFTERAWIGFRNKLIPEYTQLVTALRIQRQENERRLSVDVAIQARQMDIVKLVFELLRPEIEQQSIHRSPSPSDSNNDSEDATIFSRENRESSFMFEGFLIKYLPWCPSFRNPPFINKDPRILW